MFITARNAAKAEKINEGREVFYREDEDTSPLLHVMHTAEAVELLTAEFGQGMVPPISFTYIEVNVPLRSWRATMDYEWLYRNRPIVIDLKQLKRLIDECNYKGGSAI